MIDLLTALIKFLTKGLDFFKKKPTAPPVKPERTSEQVDEVEYEETDGDMTAIVKKMIKVMRKEK